MKVINFTDGSYLCIATLDNIEFPANTMKLVGQTNAYFFVGGHTQYATLLTPVHTHYRIDKEGNIWTFRVDGTRVQFSITDPSFNVIASATVAASGQWKGKAAYFCISGETETQYLLEVVEYTPIYGSYVDNRVVRYGKVINDLNGFNDILNNHTEPRREATNTITGDEFAEFMYGHIASTDNTFTEDEIFRGRPWTGTATRSSAFYLNKSLFDDTPSPPGPTPPEPGDDPFSPGGTSTTGGGGMTGDPPPHDPIDFPSLPSISATNAGMVSIWVPTLSELQRFAAYLWNTDIFTSGFWKNLVSSPIDLFYGLNIMPVPIDRQQVHTDTVTYGWIDTEIMWDYIDEQYIEIDCGTLDMDEYWNAYLDYAPYTKIDIYLPYIGVKHLNTNDVMNKTINLKYVIDLGSGACVAMIKSDDSILYHFAGNCATPIPVSSIQFQEIVRNITSTAVSAVGGILGAAVSPAIGVGGMAGVVSGAIKTFTTDHATVNRSGAMGSSSGLMGVQTPYLIVTRPRMAVPENQNTYTGYPSFITEQIGDLEGYTEVEIIHMHDLTCTSEEFTEIEDLLLKGVII